MLPGEFRQNTARVRGETQTAAHRVTTNKPARNTGGTWRALSRSPRKTANLK